MSSTSTTVKAWGSTSATDPLALLNIRRRGPGPKDVAIDIEYCGICHSDVHTLRGEWAGSVYPCVPGHEIIGTVTAVGADVTKYKVGDTVGVGCMVDSCRKCDQCDAHDEQYCPGRVFTYNETDAHLGGHTYGGYSEAITVDESFVLSISKGMDKAAAAPLLCAGVTTYAPLKRAGVTKGTRVGVVGLGGLGHIAIKIAAAMGAEVTIITTTASKVADAEKLGATKAIISTDAAAMAAAAGTLDVILDTVSAPHDVMALAELLRIKGQMVLLGMPPEDFPMNAGALVTKGKTLTGWLIGGLKETQEMLDFCAEHKVVADVETIPVTDVNSAYERLLKSDVKYRFVIDIKTLKEFKA